MKDDDNMNTNESTDADKALEIFAMLSHAEFRQKLGQEKVDEAMEAAIGILESRLKDANLDTFDFSLSVP